MGEGDKTKLIALGALVYFIFLFFLLFLGENYKTRFYSFGFLFLSIFSTVFIVLFLNFSLFQVGEKFG
jgi:hypothetical protein